MQKHYPSIQKLKIPDIEDDLEIWFDFWDLDQSGTLSKIEVVKAILKTLSNKITKNL